MPRSLRLAPPVLADAGRVYVRSLPLIVLVAVAVFGLTDVSLHALNDWLDHSIEVADAAAIAFNVTLLVVVLASSLFAEVLFAGLLDRVVESGLERRRPPSLGALVAGIPFLRLLVADTLVVGLGALGLFLLVLPGLAAFTLLALAGPLVIVEGLRPWQAIRRSFELLRRRPAAAVVLVLVPSIVISSVEDWIAEMASHWSTPATVLASVAVNATLAAYAGLLLAVLARRLTSGRGAWPHPAPP
jgi:hypothetical protein